METNDTNGRRSAGQWIIIAMSSVAVLGSLIGVYSGINRDIAENRQEIEDLKQQISKFEIRTEVWQTQQRAYDAELRGRMIDADNELRDGLRLLTSKVLDKSK